MNHRSLERIAEEYNAQSDSYHVVIADYGYAAATDEEYDPLKIITAESFLDLIFSGNNSLMSALTENAYIEDLCPYINSSEQISFDMLAEPVKTVYLTDGKMYAVPRRFSLTTLAGKKSELGKPGWTVDEFLQWLIEHPDRSGMINLSRDGILNICLEPVLDACYDSERGEFHMEEPVFRQFLEKMKELQPSDTVKKPTPADMMASPDRSYLAECEAENLTRAALEETEIGEEVVFKGYPSIDGTPRAYLQAYALSMFATSKVKEGAYDFMEFFLLYEGQEFGNSSSETQTRLYTVKNNLDNAVKTTLQLRGEELQAALYGTEAKQVTKEQIDKVLNLFPYAAERKIKYDAARKIIEEEIGAYLKDQKDLDSVCSVIQNRVQLYLDEGNAN